MEPIAGMVRDGQGNGAMTAEMCMGLANIKASTLCHTKPLTVFMLPDRNDSINVELKIRQVPVEDLLQVTKVTRREVLNALVSRHFDRVWNTNTSDPSFFREESIALLPPYRNAKHLDMIRLMPGDEKGVPAKFTSTVPTPATDVQRRRAETWAEIRRRAVAVATARLAEREDSDEIRAAKRARFVASESDTGTAPQTASSTSARWAAFVDDEAEAEAEETMSPEMVAEKEVEEELKRFHTLKVRTADCQLREGLKHWGNRGRLPFTNLRAVVQQVLGNQASAAQIERDFGGAGQLLSARRSRMDAYYVEIMLFLHLNFDKIPRYVPALKSEAIASCLPKRFTGRDAELWEAENYFEHESAAELIEVVGKFDTDDLVADNDEGEAVTFVD